jgi:hypothetical protein
MRMTTLYAALAGAFLLGTAALSSAQSSPPPAGSDIAHPIKNATTALSKDYRAEHEAIESTFKADKATCKPMTGNAKDVCIKEAKGKEKVALAELEAKRKGTPSAQYDVQVAKAKAAYEVAQEKCDDLKGADKTACKKQAKADESKALAEAKASRKTVAANTTTPPVKK